MKSEQIKKAAQRLMRKFETSDPFEMAHSLGIIIVIEPLGQIRGLYNTEYKQKFIHINDRLSHKQQTFVCAHELGHAVLHTGTNTHFLRGHTLYSLNRYEKEAHLFAAFILISDDDLEENKYLTYEQMARLTGISEDIVRMRVNGI